MKQIFKYLLTAFIILSFIGCEEKPALFLEKDGLYFTTNTFAYSFAKYPKKLKDTIQIPIQVLGNLALVDRSITIKSIKSPDFGAVEGVHYQLLNNTVMPANMIKTTIPVVVYRTADLELAPVQFALNIDQNAEFSKMGITDQQTIIVNLAYIQQPDSWGTYTGASFAGYSGNFGTWTKTKYKLILDVLYNSETGTTVTEFPGGRTQPQPLYPQYVALVRNYIKLNYPGNYGGTGATLRDPDANNQLIQVGPANY